MHLISAQKNYLLFFLVVLARVVNYILIIFDGNQFMYYQCKHDKKYNLFFSKLGLIKGVLIKIRFISAGVALENLLYDLSDYLLVLEHLVKYLIIWASFY